MLAVMAVLAVMAWSVARFERRWRATVRRCGGNGGLEVLDLDVPVAYAVPGEPDHIVNSAPTGAG